MKSAKEGLFRDDEPIKKDHNTGAGEYQDFIEDLPVMVYAVKPRPPYSPVYVSPAFAQFGYPLEVWTHDPNIWLKVIHEDDRKWVFDETKSSTRTGKEVEYEYRIIAADGSVHWVHDRGCLIRSEDGKISRRQGVLFDITPQKLSDQELEKREKQYRTLARNIPRTAVLLFDRDFRYTLADGELLRKHGFSREMFEGNTLFELFPPEICREYADHYERALGGDEIVFETEYEQAHLQINVLPVKDENGEIFAGMVMWHDITERRKAEAELKESEERYRNLFENANDLIYVMDFEGHYLSINHACERVFGYTSEEARKLTINDVATPEHVEIAKRHFARKINGEAAHTTYEADCLTKDGRRVTLEINSGLIYKDGVPIAVQGVARDVTERKRTEMALIRSEMEYRDLFENANDLIYTHDLSGNFTSLNRAGECITGYTREEAVKLNISQVVAPEFLERAWAMLTEKINGAQSTAFELEIIAKCGERVSLELSTRLIFIDGKPVGVQGIGRDITARKQAERSLHNALSLFASTFESTADGIIVMNSDRQIVAYNQKFVEMWSVPASVLESRSGQDLMEFAADLVKDRDSFFLHLQQLFENHLATATHNVELNDGRVFERYSQPHFLEGKPVGRVCCYRDITERERAEERLRHYALHDTLTNLPNRVEFMNQLKLAIERTERNRSAKFAVLFLDLDRFKIINDSLGHVIGDKLLVAIAEKLRASVRPGDIVARLGGDEFTVLLNRTGDINEVQKVAERLLVKLSEPFNLDNYEVFTTVSIGIIIADDVHRQPEDFLRDADTAMYRAKEAGKARYEIFDREMHAHNLNVLQLETDLRHAIERKEFEVHYQPIVCLETETVCEFEALIRWNHPVHGLIYPDTFIKVAEETGLIVQVGQWILEETCRQIADWQSNTSHVLSVSVNLSAKQLVHPCLTAQVSRILKENGLNPRQLKLEVTESTVMEHSERSLGVLQELHEMGVLLSTDDFGTGYSSLSYLHRFPFSRLKIDRSFVSKMHCDEKSEAIVKTILMLGENLNIEVVAEGVEDSTQLELLRALGCRLGQGYIFSPPVNANVARHLLDAPAAAFRRQYEQAAFTEAGDVLETLEVQ
jgi:diguanylate cyclase (GGDEF)-like protein/PAS domain S-box-containing protein